MEITDLPRAPYDPKHEHVGRRVWVDFGFPDGVVLDVHPLRGYFVRHDPDEDGERVTGYWKPEHVWVPPLKEKVVQAAHQPVSCE